MTTDEAIEFLRSHQPMPPDSVITELEADTFVAALDHLEKHPDPRCVPLLINAMSDDTWLGMYERVAGTLMFHDRDHVVPHLRDALVHGPPGVQWRCCYWAAQAQAWDLEPIIRRLARSKDQNVASAAVAYLDMRSEAA